jgi:outer membrane protein TolC
MRTYRSVVGLLVLVLSGCASIPDQPGLADALGELPPTFDGLAAAPASPAADDGVAWYLVFEDPALEALVLEAGQANADVAIAALRMREAYALAQAERASRWPLLGLGGQATRGRLAEAAGESVQEFATVGLQASYEVDLWGRLAAGRAAAFERYLADRHAADAVRLSVTGNVVRSYFDLQLLRERVRILEASLEAFDRSLALSTRRHEEGLLSELDLQRLRAEREDIAARQIDAAQAARDAERRLVLLLGRAPTATARATLPVTAIDDASALVPAVPIGVPSELLHRPDLRAA